MGNGNFRKKGCFPLSSLTSLGELKTTPPASTTGLVTEIGLVKADSRLEERGPDLCSILLAFHALALARGGTGLGTSSYRHLEP